MQLDGYEKGKGITSTGLKLIAVTLMLIDHIGASIVERTMAAYAGGTTALPAWATFSYTGLAALDIILRLVGRLAFPIFCFCLAEGFYYTRSRKKYLTGLIIFAFVSEIPFDFALYNGEIGLTSQNVFFTLAIGLGSIWAIEALKSRIVNRVASALVSVIAVVAFAAFAELINTDYGAIGVLVINVIYDTRLKGRKTSMALCDLILTIANPLEISAFANVAIVHFYNGKRGKGMKYFFYVFYPAHLLILGIICRCLGV